MANNWMHSLLIVWKMRTKCRSDPRIGPNSYISLCAMKCPNNWLSHPNESSQTIPKRAANLSPNVFAINLKSCLIQSSVVPYVMNSMSLRLTSTVPILSVCRVLKSGSTPMKCITKLIALSPLWPTLIAVPFVVNRLSHRTEFWLWIMSSNIWSTNGLQSCHYIENNWSLRGKHSSLHRIHISFHKLIQIVFKQNIRFI